MSTFCALYLTSSCYGSKGADVVVLYRGVGLAYRLAKHGLQAARPNYRKAPYTFQVVGDTLYYDSVLVTIFPSKSPIATW